MPKDTDNRNSLFCGAAAAPLLSWADWLEGPSNSVPAGAGGRRVADPPYGGGQKPGAQHPAPASRDANGLASGAAALCVEQGPPAGHAGSIEAGQPQEDAASRTRGMVAVFDMLLPK